MRGISKKAGVIAVLALASSLAIPASPASANHTSCTMSVDNPHYSSGAGGIITKAKIYCTGSGVSAKVEAMLWLCPKKGDRTEAWVSNNCQLKGYGDNFYTPVPVAKTQVTYARESGQPGARGKGYWIACGMFEVYHGTTKYSYTRMSSFWYGSA